ncbi:predicted protein [Plenodomus lingam JN3]|uniref:Predicted protein n=1 Tax=Leptosphaeria maculans (strain JN3 / isolate v23.1.3 / race Av1-4-5-6-7-8) TaxID=985895 RepID=E5A873_LEPMJ|nr:predicted protein [Plenodomus lingam JN3]CBX99818.1 predicted protein [Plenodomus lingam JN3]
MGQRLVLFKVILAVQCPVTVAVLVMARRASRYRCLPVAAPCFGEKPPPPILIRFTVDHSFF